MLSLLCHQRVTVSRLCTCSGVQALTAVALLCGGDYDEGGGAGMVGPRYAFAVVRQLLANADQVLEMCRIQCQLRTACMPAKHACQAGKCCVVGFSNFVM